MVPIQCSFGVALEYVDRPDESTLQCFKSKNLLENLLIVHELDTGFLHIDPELLPLLKSLGMNITVSIFPCRARDPVVTAR